MKVNGHEIRGFEQNDKDFEHFFRAPNGQAWFAEAGTFTVSPTVASIGLTKIPSFKEDYNKENTKDTGGIENLYIYIYIRYKNMLQSFLKNIKITLS